MKYILGQSATALASVGAADTVAAWPVSAVLGIEKLSTTTLKVHLQAQDNTGDAGFVGAYIAAQIRARSVAQNSRAQYR